MKAHDIGLNNYEFNTLVAGHLTRLGTRDDVSIQKEFIIDLQKASTTAYEEPSAQNPWTRTILVAFVTILWIL